MSEIYDEVLLTVVDSGEKEVYRKIIVGGLPTYFAPQLSTGNPKEFYVDRSIFIPITKEEFASDREHQFIGYMYTFINSGHQTVSLGPDPLKLGVTYAQLTFTINRFRYYISGEDEITLDHVFDALLPPKTIDLEVSSSKFGEVAQGLTMQTIAELNKYYVDKRI